MQNANRFTQRSGLLRRFREKKKQAVASIVTSEYAVPILALVCLISLVALPIILKTSGADSSAVCDSLAYVCPSIAAVIAGATFLTRGRLPQGLYPCSIVILLAGEIFYCVAHPVSKGSKSILLILVLLLAFLFVVMIMVGNEENHVSGSPHFGDKFMRGTAFVLFATTLIIAVAAFFYYF